MAKGKGKAKKIVKYILLIILCVILLIAGVTAIVNTICVNKNTTLVDSYKAVDYSGKQLTPSVSNDGYYTFTTSKNLKVMQLTDIHIGGGWMSYKKDIKAITAVAEMIKTEKPDLVIATGDTAYPVPFQAGTFNNKSAAKLFGRLMDNLGVYWTITFGNHDTELYAFHSRKYISNYYANHKYNDADKKTSFCLYQPGPETVNGYGNSVINVTNSKGVITQSLITMDTGSYVDGDYFGIKWKYDGLHKDQINWYKNTLKKFGIENKKIDENSGIPKSLVFFHIPIEEYKIACNEYVDNGKKDTNDTKYLWGEVGEKKPYVYSSFYKDNFFETAKELGSTQAMFCGHDHLNNIGLNYKGINLIYGYSIDYLAYAHIDRFGSQRGNNMITITPKGTFSCKYNNYYGGKYKSGTDEKKSVKMTPYYPNK